MSALTKNPSLSRQYEHQKEGEAWRENLRVASLAADKIRSSLGPNGAYKMVVYNRGPQNVVKITKDAVTVLEEIAIQQPAAAVIFEAAKMHREEIGDGVTSFVLFTSSLLKKADELVSKGVHPNIILDGYNKAAKKALELIAARSSKPNGESFENLLKTVDCGRGILTSEICKVMIQISKLAHEKGKFDKDEIRIVRKPGGSVSESRLVNGLIVKKAKVHPNMPDIVENPRIAITSGRFGSNRVEVKMRGQGPFNLKFEMDTPEKMSICRQAEKEFKMAAFERLLSMGVTVLFCQQPIDDFLKSKLADQGVLAFETTPAEDCEALSKAVHAKIVGSLADLSESDIGGAKKLELEKIGLEPIILLTGCEGATLLLRGSNMQVLDELELLIRNALTLLQFGFENDRILVGGGSIETYLAKELQRFSLEHDGREQLAIARFADSLMEIPRCLAENNGLDPNSTLAELKAHYEPSCSSFGVGLTGCSESVCIELSEVKSAMIKRAYEVAALLLRIDEMVKSKEMVKFHKQ